MAEKLATVMPPENLRKLIIDVFYKLRPNFNQISVAVHYQEKETYHGLLLSNE